MKADIHPVYYDSVTATCTGCGTSFQTGSTKQSISVHVCAKCHPFYTGEQKFVDTKGKVEKFRQKVEKAKEQKAIIAEKKAKKAEKSQRETKSLRELLGEM